MPKRFPVLWTKTAERDLEEIIDFIANDSSQRAWRIFLRLREFANSLQRAPLRCRIVPELRARNVLIYRELIVRPYRIIFKVVKNRVVILGVFDGRRNLQDILFDRLLRS